MSKENNKIQVDIENLFKQNVNDLLSIKELYKRIEELGEKITQVKYIDNSLVKKLKKEYENLKKIILDENIQAKLNNDIETIISQMNNIAQIQEKKIYQFSNIETMKSYKLKKDDVCETLGYYTINDGGGAKYIIENTQSLADDCIQLNNGLYAKLIINNDKINIKQLGGKCNDNTFDNFNCFKKFENIAKYYNKQLTLYIPQGIWYTSPYTFTKTTGVSIIGISSNMQGRDNQNTVLKPFIDNQSHIFKIGNDNSNGNIEYANLVTGYFLDKLVFSGKISDSALIIKGCMYSHIGLLNFRFIDEGYCFNISNSWEIQIDKLIFRVITSYKACIYFDKQVKILNSSIVSNVSAIYFDYITIEDNNGNCIETHPKAAAVHNEFNVVNIERNWANNRLNSLPSEIIESDCIKNYIFYGFFNKSTINTINYNDSGVIYTKDINNNYHVLKAIFSDDIEDTEEESYFTYRNYNLNVGVINAYGNGNVYLCSSHNSMRNSILTIGSLSLGGRGIKMLDMDNGMIVTIGIVNYGGVFSNRIMNTLMNKLQQDTKSQTSSKCMTLKTVDDAIDITGCVLSTKFTSILSCFGVKKIKVICKMDNELGGKAKLGYKTSLSDSYSYSEYTLNEGFNTLEIDLTVLPNTVNYYNLTSKSSTQILYIYAMEYIYF